MGSEEVTLIQSCRTQDSETKMFRYFTQLTKTKALFYGIVALYVVAVFIVSVLEPFMTIECGIEKELEYANPAYDASPCRQMRYLKLFGFTPEECSYGRRLVASIIMGGVIGWERREADRPAGIRTMSLVSLGSCLFTINSAMAFLNGPMGWDASRVSAAIPSGVGFLGAGLIFKKEQTSPDGETSHLVHGLTTAASVWISAAVGIACGGELYMAASFGTALMMLLLRFGPRGSDETEDDDDEELVEQLMVKLEEKDHLKPLESTTSAIQAKSPTDRWNTSEYGTGKVRPTMRKKKSTRASLAAAV